jgi:hypothetical protein
LAGRRATARSASWSHRAGSAFTAQIASAAGVAAIGAVFFSIEAAQSARLAPFAAPALFALSIAGCSRFCGGCGLLQIEAN